MSGFFGCVSRRDCVYDVFYGTDYHSHLGTKRAGMVFSKDGIMHRAIHSLDNAYFRNKFENDLPEFKGSKIGIGIISDMEAQPITITSHLGQYSIVTIGRIDNIDEIIEELLASGRHFAELSDSRINPTELVAILISTAPTFVEGVKLAQERIKGSCSMIILKDDKLYAVRDK